MFKRVLIANRGEIAVRIIRACRELGIETVAVYSAADSDALHVRLADEAYCIGPASAKQSYLHIPSIMSVAVLRDVDAVHPGYGFLAENSDFAEACEACGITFIGPSPHAIDMMGDKAVAKETMKAAGVPTVPGSDGLIESVDEAVDIAQKIGYPVIIKATAGGGGKGIRVVHDESMLRQAVVTAQREAESAFGNAGVYIEKYIEHMRHVEIQVLADRHGNVIHLGERDCSVQRRLQKLVEEAPCPVLDEETRKRMGDAAVAAARRRLRGRRDHRVYLQQRWELLLYGDEYPNSGRAPCDRVGYRGRFGPGNDSCCGRRTAIRQTGRYCVARTRD